MICSQCNHRGVRHTAVEFAMAAFERLAHIAKELRSARQNAERLSSGKRRKDAMGQVRAEYGSPRCMPVHAKCSPRRMRMCVHPRCSPRRPPFAPQALSANAEQLAAHEEAVCDMLSTIFDQVSAPRRDGPRLRWIVSELGREMRSTIFDQVRSRAGAAARVRAHASAHHGASFSLSPQVISYRYRDTHEDIRAACISSLGRALRVLPSFCDDKHLKYMGWQLSDIQSTAVRLASLQASARMQLLTTTPISPPHPTGAPRVVAGARARVQGL